MSAKMRETKCPICGKTSLFIDVSGKEFSVYRVGCRSCGFRAETGSLSSSAAFDLFMKNEHGGAAEKCRKNRIDLVMYEIEHARRAQKEADKAMQMAIEALEAVLAPGVTGIKSAEAAEDIVRLAKKHIQKGNNTLEVLRNIIEAKAK